MNPRPDPSPQQLSIVLTNLVNKIVSKLTFNTRFSVEQILSGQDRGRFQFIKKEILGTERAAILLKDYNSDNGTFIQMADLYLYVEEIEVAEFKVQAEALERFDPKRVLIQVVPGCEIGFDDDLSLLLPVLDGGIGYTSTGSIYISNPQAFPVYRESSGEKWGCIIAGKDEEDRDKCMTFQLVGDTLFHTDIPSHEVNPRADSQVLAIGPHYVCQSHLGRKKYCLECGLVYESSLLLRQMHQARTVGDDTFLYFDYSNSLRFIDIVSAKTGKVLSIDSALIKTGNILGGDIQFDLTQKCQLVGNPNNPHRGRLVAVRGIMKKGMKGQQTIQGIFDQIPTFKAQN